MQTPTKPPMLIIAPPLSPSRYIKWNKSSLKHSNDTSSQTKKRTSTIASPAPSSWKGLEARSSSTPLVKTIKLTIVMPLPVLVGGALIAYLSYLRITSNNPLDRYWAS